MIKWFRDLLLDKDDSIIYLDINDIRIKSNDELLQLLESGFVHKNTANGIIIELLKRVLNHER